MGEQKQITNVVTKPSNETHPVGTAEELRVLREVLRTASKCTVAYPEQRHTVEFHDAMLELIAKVFKYNGRFDPVNELRVLRKKLHYINAVIESRYQLDDKARPLIRAMAKRLAAIDEEFSDDGKVK